MLFLKLQIYIEKMNKDNLIKICTCGELVADNWLKFDKHNCEFLVCPRCNVWHQFLSGWSEDDYLNFYKTEYHIGYQKKKQVVTYNDRYNHDRTVSEARIQAYRNFISPPMKGLDIGSSNSAFVHVANEQGYHCIGLEIGANIGDDSVTVRSNLENSQFELYSFNFITMHDVIEHMIDPIRALKKVYDLLTEHGVLIVDLPNYWIREGEHHWKHIEHLWIWSARQFADLLKKQGLAVQSVTEPIPGKLVFYARKV